MAYQPSFDTDDSAAAVARGWAAVEDVTGIRPD